MASGRIAVVTIGDCCCEGAVSDSEDEERRRAILFDDDVRRNEAINRAASYAALRIAALRIPRIKSP